MAITGNSPQKSQKSDIKTKDVQLDETLSDIDSNSSETELLSANDIKKNAPLRLKNKDNKHTLSESEVESVEEYFQTFLLETTRQSHSTVYDIIKDHGKKENFDQDEIIISQGETGMFVYILLSGCADVMSADGHIMRRICVGEIFGEMSVLFSRPVSANVKAHTNVSVVTIPKKIVKGLLKESIGDIDAIDWCIKRRYLPLGKSVDSARMYRRLTLSIFKTIPVFLSWSEHMLKDLIISMEDKLLILYPERSYIVIEDDPLMSMFILIHGKVELKQGHRVVAALNIRNTDDPFVFSESILYCENQLSTVNIQALSNCQVIQVRKDSIMNVLDKSPTQLNDFLGTRKQYEAFKARFGSIYSYYEADLQVEVLLRYLKTCAVYAKSEADNLLDKIFKSGYHEYHLGERIDVDRDIGVYEALLVVRGELVHKPNKFIDNSNVVGVNRICTYEFERQDASMIDLNCAQEFNGESAEMVQLVVRGTGSVIALESSKCLSLKAKTRCLLLKIPRPDQIAAQSVEVPYVNGGDKTQSVRDLELV